MSVDQYQRAVINLEKEIADLEKKRAVEEKKIVDNEKYASRVKISKYATAATIKSKQRQIERYNEKARKAREASANLSKRIADKQAKRNEANIKLRREERSERNRQEREINNMKDSYEQRIAQLESKRVESIENGFKESLNDDELKYDVFISYASEDKESFADNFAQALKNNGVKVWYDRNEIDWGDSLRKEIDEGLRKSRYGVIILSNNYISEDKYWTKEELEGLFQLESVSEKRILPIWHNITKQQLIDFSPILAGRKALTTATMTADEIASELADLISSKEKE